MQFNYDDQEQVIIPESLVELQEFLDDLWEDIFSSDTEDKEKTKLYNKAAKQYNTAAKFQAISLISNFKQQQKDMATKKKAAPKKKAAAPKKKAAAKKATGTAKAGTVKKAPKKEGEKAPTQKETIVELSAKGKTIDEIVELTGFKKTNVQWYFSKLKLKGKKKDA